MVAVSLRCCWLLASLNFEGELLSELLVPEQLAPPNTAVECVELERILVVAAVVIAGHHLPDLSQYCLYVGINQDTSFAVGVSLLPFPENTYKYQSYKNGVNEFYTICFAFVAYYKY